MGVSSRRIQNRNLSQQLCPVRTWFNRNVWTPPWRLFSHFLKRGPTAAIAASPALGCDSHSFHTAMRPRRSSVRYIAICRGSGVSPRLSAALHHSYKEARLQVPRGQSGKETRHLSGHRAVFSDAPNVHDPLTRDQPACRSTRHLESCARTNWNRI